MEQHPIPRNITGFEFHLIGDMTLKQFGYLASGGLLAYLFFRLSLFPGIIRLFLAGFFALLGLAFAFLPIQERPLDRWIVIFFKSIFSPTQYLWQKEGTIPEVLEKPSLHFNRPTDSFHRQNHQLAQEKLQRYLASLPSPPHQTLEEKEKEFLQKTLSLFKTQDIAVSPSFSPLAKPTLTATTQPPLSTSFPTIPSSSSPPTSSLPSTSSSQVLPLTSSEKSAKTPPTVTPSSFPPPSAFSPQSESEKLLAELKKISQEKEALTQELKKLREEIMKLKATPPPETIPRKKTPPRKTFDFITSRETLNELGLQNFPNLPNMVFGVVRNPQQKLLPNIILTIKDNKGVPVRALKTNKLGQFSTATPLTDGTYFLEVEDPLKRYVFDSAQITLSGKTLAPLEIFAKGEKELLREKLTRELFGGTV